VTLPPPGAACTGVPGLAHLNRSFSPPRILRLVNFSFSRLHTSLRLNKRLAKLSPLNKFIREPGTATSCLPLYPRFPTAVEAPVTSTPPKPSTWMAPSPERELRAATATALTASAEEVSKLLFRHMMYHLVILITYNILGALRFSSCLISTSKSATLGIRDKAPSRQLHREAAVSAQGPWRPARRGTEEPPLPRYRVIPAEGAHRPSPPPSTFSKSRQRGADERDDEDPESDNKELFETITDLAPPLTGAGNIGDPGVKAPTSGRVDKDAVPSEAYRASTDGDFHTGRGGLGNESKAPVSETSTNGTAPISLADKLKFKIFGKK